MITFEHGARYLRFTLERKQRDRNSPPLAQVDPHTNCSSLCVVDIITSANDSVVLPAALDLIPTTVLRVVKRAHKMESPFVSGVYSNVYWSLTQRRRTKEASSTHSTQDREKTARPTTQCSCAVLPLPLPQSGLASTVRTYCTKRIHLQLLVFFLPE